MRIRSLIAVFSCLLVALLRLAGISAEEAGRTIEFNRDVRPILADHCFECHGPDAKQRQADLRLDVAEGPASKREGGPVIVAGQPEKSEFWRRLNSTDEEERMPPPAKGRKLSEREVATLKQWIVEGGRFEKHWSLVPVRRPAVPIRMAGGERSSTLESRGLAALDPSHPVANNPVDAFILARLAKEGLTPAPQADRWTILRRVTLALTGLPPTPEEVEWFVADVAPDAYERVVDRLLASPRFGERMAVPWLDAARYADTSGYQSDGERFMWRWRDWVIEALNANMPFDRFTIEQLAGDLLPNATLEQRIATGFNRNHRGNAEGGIIPEEYAVEYVADRVETTTTVWLGLTLGCARCHDHKYDPFSQREFYSLFAFFNNVPEKGRAIKIGNSPPYIPAPTRLQDEERSRLESKLVDTKRTWETESESLILKLLAWEKWFPAKELLDWHSAADLIVHLPLDGSTKAEISTSAQKGRGDDLEGHYTAGKIGQAARFRGSGGIVVGNFGEFGFLDKFTVATWIRLPAGGGGTIISRMADVPQGEGYQLVVVDGKLQLNLVKRWLDDALRVETLEPLRDAEWHHVAATYDGSRVSDGVKLYIDGQLQNLNVLLDELNQSFASKEPLRVGGGGGMDSLFRGALDDVRVYKNVLSRDDIRILVTPDSIAEIVAIPLEKRSAAQLLKLKSYYVLHHAPASMQVAHRELGSAERALGEFDEKLPTVMVMEEMPTPRETHVLLRGQYDKPGERVEADVPAELPRLPEGAPRNRLGLAQWLVSAENPLTSRVIVNRVWQLHFGTGIVRTSEDFGRQGEWPTHPELLDWLAAEFSGDWDVKRLQRTIVTSSTFRQSSGFRVQSSGLTSRDPDNRLLSRGPRLRLTADMVRDQALFAGGLLVEQTGGPSVKPVQPAGLWSELTGGDDYKSGEGADLVRRSLYTFWKRTIPPPLLSTFDASSRESCVVRDTRTNTPLQALVLLNEPTFVDAARGLAERVMKEAATPAGRIERAMLHVVGRKPTEAELAIFEAAFERYQRRMATTERDAYALVCSTILNLDEAVMSQ